MSLDEKMLSRFWILNLNKVPNQILSSEFRGGRNHGSIGLRFLLSEPSFDLYGRASPRDTKAEARLGY